MKSVDTRPPATAIRLWRTIAPAGPSITIERTGNAHGTESQYLGTLHVDGTERAWSYVWARNRREAMIRTEADLVGGGNRVGLEHAQYLAEQCRVARRDDVRWMT